MNSDLFYKKRLELTEELARRFNNFAIKVGSIVRIRILDDTNLPAFHIVYEIEDPLVDTGVYQRGHAVIYPSSRVEYQLEEFTKDLGVRLNFNNTRTVGWLS